MKYIVMGNKPNTTNTQMRTINATSARDAFLAFTKYGYVENVSVIPVVVVDEDIIITEEETD